MFGLTISIDPYTENSYGGVLGAPPIPITEEAYNSTDGYFCVTSVLTQLSAYFGTDLAVPFFAGIAQNQTALELATSIQPNIICNQCLFAALEVIEAVYPGVGDAELQAIGAYLAQAGLPAVSLPNTTINGFANETCAYEDLSVSTSTSFLPARVYSVG